MGVSARTLQEWEQGRGNAKACQAVLAGMIGRRIDQGGGEARAMEMRERAHERITLERTRTALVVEIEVTSAAHEQYQRDAPALRRRARRARERVARGGTAVRLDRHHLAATIGRRRGVRLCKGRRNRRNQQQRGKYRCGGRVSELEFRLLLASSNLSDVPTVGTSIFSSIGLLRPLFKELG